MIKIDLKNIFWNLKHLFFGAAITAGIIALGLLLLVVIGSIVALLETYPIILLVLMLGVAVFFSMQLSKEIELSNSIDEEVEEEEPEELDSSEKSL